MGQVAIDDEALVRDDSGGFVVHDVARLRLSIVNVAFVGSGRGSNAEWVLIDAGITNSASAIRSFAEQRFGNTPPRAILLTHGHFDHVGSVEALAEEWDVPVYAHPLEMPYLTGASEYPPPDPKVGGGLLAALSSFFPTGPVNLSGRLRELPANGEIPFLPGWTWLHTPGHSTGHVSFWREADRTLIAGDAVITTAQESAYAVLTQKPELHGPPQYFTIDWDKSRASVQRLAALEPEVLLTGHGPPLQGGLMRQGLHQLADNFERIAVPSQGRYVDHPVKFKTGEAYPGH